MCSYTECTDETEICQDRKTILIVDDEKDVLLMIEKRLAAEGYSVITANNGAKALMLAKSEKPDLIILDLVMPGMQGDEVAEKLKESPETKDIPVAFLTALVSRAEVKKYGSVIGGNMTFPKPFEPEEFLAQIKKVFTKTETD